MLPRMKLSDGLRLLMWEQRHVLERNRHKPPQGKCVDCKRDILATEIAVKCDVCENSFVCVKCVDKHDHIHKAMAQLPN